MNKTLLKTIPKSPWIYKFLDNKKNIIYIWKSINLFSRVNSYFSWKSKLNFAKKKMIMQVNYIETIITKNEWESLILETNLIKENKPKYNILMKDDKNHMYIKITDDEFPKIIKTRIKNKNWTYFWPYVSTSHVKNILKTLKKHFWYGCYDINFFRVWKEYNLDKYIFKNIENNIKIAETERWELINIKEVYNNQIKNIKNFLTGDFKKLLRDLEEKMKNSAKNLEFELADKIKKQIQSIKILEIEQNINNTIKWNYNVINFIRKFERFFIWLIEIKDSKIIWYNNFELKNSLWEEDSEIVKEFIERKIAENIEDNNKTYLIPENLKEIKNEISKLAKIETPKIWVKIKLLEMVYKNIYEYAYKKHISSLSVKWFTKKTMKDLLKILSYERINKSIVFECNDISHLSWSNTVGSRSVIENWKLNSKKYRKFKIKSLKDWKIDDFTSMKEVMERRLKEIEKIWNIPDLIIIDGWKWQLSSICEVIENFCLTEKIQVVSIAKKDEELFLPWKNNSILLKKDSLELRLVQKIRDEAHRFAISFNRDRRIKQAKKNILESLPWFWPETRKKLLKTFWSVERLKEIKKEDLSAFLNKNQLETLENHWIIN